MITASWIDREGTSSFPVPTRLPEGSSALPQFDHCVALLAMDRLSVADVDCR